jgi:hypothetical protein
MGIQAYIFTSTSPGPGSGVSTNSMLVKIFPGSAYTAALCCFGMVAIFKGECGRGEKIEFEDLYIQDMIVYFKVEGQTANIIF